MIKKMYTTKELREDVIAKSFFKPYTTKNLLRLWIETAQEEIYNLHPLFLPERKRVVLALPDKKFLKNHRYSTDIPCWKEVFTLDDDVFLEKVVNKYRKIAVYKQNQVDVYSLKQLADTYLNLIEQHKSSTYLGIEGIIKKTNERVSTIPPLSEALVKKRPEQIEMPFYSLATRHSYKVLLNKEDYHIACLLRTSDRIL